MMMKLFLTVIMIVLSATAMVTGKPPSGSEIFSMNFYKDDTNGNLTIEPDQSAGMDDWHTTGWSNQQMLHGTAGGLPPVTLTSSSGNFTSRFHLISARNGGPFSGVRTTMLGDGNADLMDGHVNATEDPYDGSLIFNIEVSNIPLLVYDVIIYMGGKWGDNTGKYVFNGGPVKDFKTMSTRFDGTFVEIVNGEDAGNYILFENVTGDTFTARVWGNGFNHIGPCGIQYGVTDTSGPSVNAGSDWITWSGKPVTLNNVIANNNDPTAGNLTLSWSAQPVAGITVDFSDNSVKEPTVTITKSADTDSATPVTLTLSVSQPGKTTEESSITIDVYDDACKAAVATGNTVIGPGDFDADCTIDIDDLARIAAAWLVDFSYDNPVEK